MIAKYRVVYNRLKRLNKDGTAPIAIEAYYKGKRKYFPTNISVKTNEWDEKTNRISRKYTDYQKANLIISKMLSRLEEIEFVAFQTNGTFDLSYLDNFCETNNDNFYDFMEKSIDKRDVVKYSKIKHRRVLRYLKEFKPNLKFNSISFQFISDFDEFLRTKKNLHQNTIHGIHKTIKTYIKLAANSELFLHEKNPYLKFKLKKIETFRETLTETEVERIEKMFVPSGSDFIGIIRDMFLFSCYTGLRFADLQSIIGADFIHEKDRVYMSIMQEKTERRLDIPLHILFNGKALAIYEKYKPEIRTENIFPKYTNQAANRVLKIIAVSCKIEKPLTFHIGRHTFGTLIAKYTGDPFLIQNLMGHSDIKTSMIYIHLSKKNIEDKLKNIKW